MLANVLVPSLVLFGLGTAMFLYTWFTTGKYTKPREKGSKE